MRVTGAQPRPTVAIRARRQPSAGAERFHLTESAPGEAAGAPAAIAYLAGIDALMALQGGPDPESERRHALANGKDILDQLDALRLALLEGSVALPHLHRLARALESAPPAPADPEVHELLRAIQLRAHVELAKRGHAQPEGSR